MEIQDKGVLKWPAKIKAGTHRRDKDKYCLFHRDHGHATPDCYDLKEAIESLIRDGRLKEYVKEVRAQERPNQRRDDERSPPPQEIRTIVGGPAGGESNRSRKEKARQARGAPWSEEVRLTRTPNEILTFSTEESPIICQPHNDALVVSLTISNIRVRRILVDGGSSADILSLTAYDAMKLGRERLKPNTTPLVGFGGSTLVPEGSIELPVTFGEGDNIVLHFTNFLVVNENSAYNAILGRPTIHGLRAVASTYHQLIKFPTPMGVGQVQGDQRASRECYHTALRGVVGNIEVQAMAEEIPGKVTPNVQGVAPEKDQSSEMGLTTSQGQAGRQEEPAEEAQQWCPWAELGRTLQGLQSSLPSHSLP